MHKTRAVIAAGTLLLLSVAGTSYADDPAAKQPLDQAMESVDKNLARDPDNKGLQNAAERLQTNQERYKNKREEQNAKRLAKKNKQAEIKAERTERPARPERPPPPKKPGRP